MGHRIVVPVHTKNYKHEHEKPETAENGAEGTFVTRVNNRTSP